MPCKEKSEVTSGERWNFILWCEICFIPALITLIVSVKNGELPSTAAVALSTIPITLLGWFASASLNRKNAATQAKNSEVNKAIEQIEAALKDLSESFSTAMKETDRKAQDSVIIAQINVAKVQRIKNLLARLHALDSSQESMDSYIIQLRKLATDESNFVSDDKLAKTFNMLVRIEERMCSRFVRRF
ncbi:TPA: hypothetical protein ACSP8C_003362 [Aeromonas veronii]